MHKLQYLMILFLLFYSTLLALEPIPLEKNEEYKKAFQEYKNNNYKETFTILDTLVKQYPQNEKVNYYYARSAYELKNYETAFIIYDKILINNPMNHRVRLEYARTLLMLKSYENAKLEFEKVLSSPIPPQVRTNVEKFLQIIKDKQKKFFINNVALFSLGWDDNLDNATYEYNNNLIDGLTNSNTEKKKDYSFKNILISNIVIPSQSNKKLAWENTILSYMQEQKKYHQNDVFLLSLNSGLGYLGKNYKNSTSLLYDNIWVGGDKSFYTYGIKNSFQYQIDQKKKLTLTTAYKKKKNIKQTDQDKNSNTKNLTLEYNLLLDNKDKLSFFSDIEITRKESGTRTDISKNSFTYKVSYEKKFWDSYTYNISYEFEDSNYKIASINGTETLPKRKDDQHAAKIKITKTLNKKQNVSLELARIDNSSNNNIYSYKKNKVNLNYMVLF